MAETQLRTQPALLALLARVGALSIQGRELEHLAAAAHNAALERAQDYGLSPAMNTSYDFLSEGNKSYYRALVDALATFLLRNPVTAAKEAARESNQQTDALALAELLPAHLHGAALAWHVQNRIQAPGALNVNYHALDDRLKDYYRGTAEAMLREAERRGEEQTIWGSPWA